MSSFRKATKARAFLRLALFGPAGSGKTMTALRLATGIAGAIGSEVAAIDSERGSMSKYADRFDFAVCDMERRTVEEYVAKIKEAAGAGFGVLVIDSTSHAWQELLEEVDRITAASNSKNSWQAWSKGTPKQKRFIDAILSYPGHVIVTMRSKTEWQAGEGRNGKTQPIRVGLAPEQGKGIEYEFDLLGQIDAEHQMTIIKDRTGRYQDEIIPKPGEEFGRELALWLQDGTAPARVESPAPPTAPKPEPAPPPARHAEQPRNLSELYDRMLRKWGEAEGDNSEPTQAARRERIVNRAISEAIKAGIVVEAAVSKANGSRDPAKARDCMGWLWAEHRPWLIKAAADYLREKLDEAARRKDAETNPDAPLPEELQEALEN